MNEIESIGSIINSTVQSSATNAIEPRSSKDSVPLWGGLILQMAQDYRQDFAPGSIRYWRLKLLIYRDEEIYEALLSYNEKWFPAIAEIREILERMRERRAEEKAAQEPPPSELEIRQREDWERFKFENGLHPDLSFQAYYVQQNKEKFDALWAKIVRK